MSYKYKIKSLDFKNQTFKTPSFRFNKSGKFVNYGDDNLLPNHLLNMYKYEGSALHTAIINKKVKMTLGEGIYIDSITDNRLLDFIEDNEIDELINQLSLDYELFNGFAIEVIMSKYGDKVLEINHLPFHKLRFGLKDDEQTPNYYWFSNDWQNYRKGINKPTPIIDWNEKDNIKSDRYVIIHKEYTVDSDYYPTPIYSNVINWITLDYTISKFHLNQATNGYYPSILVNLANGVPESDDIMSDIEYEFEQKFAGADNAGKMILTYSDDKEHSPEILSFNSNESDERFINLKEQINENIVTGSEIPGGLMLLIPGKLGNTTDRVEMNNELMTNYIKPRRNKILKMINKIIRYNDYEINKIEIL